MSPYTLLAKLAVEAFIKKEPLGAFPTDLPQELLTKRAGVFVTIENNGQLRGCIGTYKPTKVNIAEEIIDNAIAAAVKDYRFRPINEEELPLLSFTVYVLSEPKLVQDDSELDPEEYGILVKDLTGFRSGLLLPGLEGINTPEQQIFIARQKGEIDLNEEVLIYKFTAQKYSDK